MEAHQLPTSAPFRGFEAIQEEQLKLEKAEAEIQVHGLVIGVGDLGWVFFFFKMQ